MKSCKCNFSISWVADIRNPLSTKKLFTTRGKVDTSFCDNADGSNLNRKSGMAPFLTGRIRPEAQSVQQNNAQQLSNRYSSTNESKIKQKKKKTRTTFTAFQLEELERAFERAPYPGCFLLEFQLFAIPSLRSLMFSITISPIASQMCLLVKNWR